MCRIQIPIHHFVFINSLWLKMWLGLIMFGQFTENIVVFIEFGYIFFEHIEYENNDC